MTFPSVTLIIMSVGSLDLLEELVECARVAYAEEWQEAPSDDEVRASITISWSRVLTANTDYQLHRVLVALGEDQADWEDAERLLSAFCEKVRELVDRRPPCIWCLTRFFSSAQLRQHQVLYRDIYDIEMRLREVLTYIFLDAMPDRPYTFLDRNAVKLQGGDACHTEEYLKAHNENQLFHILFSDYEGLNRNVIARPTDLIALIRDNQTYDALREAAAETPVKSERHTSFISGLRELVPAIEEVRNAIAHNRDLTKRTRENYDVVKPRLLRAIDEFWTAEAATAGASDEEEAGPGQPGAGDEVEGHDGGT